MILCSIYNYGNGARLLNNTSYICIKFTLIFWSDVRLVMLNVIDNMNV